MQIFVNAPESVDFCLCVQECTSKQASTLVYTDTVGPVAIKAKFGASCGSLWTAKPVNDSLNRSVISWLMEGGFVTILQYRSGKVAD